MTRHVRALSPLMWAVLIFAALIALIGIALLAFGPGGSSTFSIFGQSITSANAGVMALFIAGVVAVLLGRRVIMAIEFTSKAELDSRPDSVLHRYEVLRAGARTPEANVSLIEEIANSSDPHRERYLSEVAVAPIFSFVEQDAAKLASESAKKGREVKNLFRCVADAEKRRLMRGLGLDDRKSRDAFLEAVFGLKYWRYLNRPSHPEFDGIERKLAEVATELGHRIGE